MAFTQDDLTAINKAIASGKKRVTFSDRTVEYNDTSQLLKARETILAELASSDPANRVSRLRKIKSVGMQ